jgi:transketolase
VTELDQLRKVILDVATKNQCGHIPSALSILELIYVVYEEFIVGHGDSPQDKFVLSKGHGSLALYAVLNHFGFISKSILYSFCTKGSPLGGHPDSTKCSYIEASTGSLGHGFPFGVGLALSKKIKQESGTVYVLVGDGELNEGTNWESLLTGSQLNLDNVVLIVDQNHSSDKAVDLEVLPDKFRAFGWFTIEVDGHSLSEIRDALKHKSHKPKAVIANTQKGFGVKEMLNNPAWHNTRLSQQDYDLFVDTNFR